MKIAAPQDNRQAFIAQLNSFLPPDIRAFTLSKVSKAFNSKSHCTKRKYHYLLPTYVLQAASEVNGLLQAHYDRHGPVAGAGYEGGYVEENSRRSVGRAGLQEIHAALTQYRAPEAVLASLREALKTYVGTRSYHNFTTGKSPTDANSKRYILSFDCGEPFVDAASGVEWVLLSVVGQSFLLNQIRKMVGMAVEVARCAAPLSTIQDAFTTRKVLFVSSFAWSLACVVSFRFVASARILVSCHWLSTCW
jgi:tRNA pseudouridine38-40 synthase